MNISNCSGTRTTCNALCRFFLYDVQLIIRSNGQFEFVSLRWWFFKTWWARVCQLQEVYRDLWLTVTDAARALCSVCLTAWFGCSLLQNVVLARRTLGQKLIAKKERLPVRVVCRECDFSARTHTDAKLMSILSMFLVKMHPSWQRTNDHSTSTVNFRFFKIMQSKQRQIWSNYYHLSSTDQNKKNA